MDDSKKHARPPEDDKHNNLQQTLKRIKTDTEFVRQYYSTCCEMKTALDTQIETIDSQNKRRARAQEEAFYFYESIGSAIARSTKDQNWIIDDSVDYEEGLCSSDDCYYDRHSGRRSGFAIYRLPGFDYTVCDVCFGNDFHHDSGGFEDWLRDQNGITLESDWDVEYRKNQDGMDVSQYEKETLGERSQRVYLDNEWNDDEVLENCHFQDGKATQRLIGTTFCLCDACFKDEMKRAQLAKSIVESC